MGKRASAPASKALPKVNSGMKYSMRGVFLTQAPPAVRCAGPAAWRISGLPIGADRIVL